MSYIKPKLGTTALLKYDLPISSVEFCATLIEQAGVMFTLGQCARYEGYVCVGYTNNRQMLETGLTGVSGFLPHS